MLPLSEKVKVLHLTRKKKKLYAEVSGAKLKENSIWEILKKEKEIFASFAVALQTAKVMATVRDTCLVKKEKALNLWVEEKQKTCSS